MDDVHLIVFHVGPVQEFITSARRSRDLWFGSWMLSELSKAAAEEIVKQNGGDVEWSLVFPAPRSLSELRSERFNAANRIVARTRRDPTELGKAVRTQVLRRLREISDGAFSRVDRVAKFNRQVAELQVDDLLEVFWASCPLRDDYARARVEVEALMAARKVTRDFAPSRWGSSEDKSSLDGLRESVIPQTAFKGLSQDDLRKQYGVRRGERLCGVGLLKRHGKRGQGDRFFSTSHVAAQPLLERLTEDHRSAVEEYTGTLRKLGMEKDDLNTVPIAHHVFGYADGHLLFSERLAEFFEGEELEQAQEALNSLLKTAFAGDRPSPYYVMLHADGDHMGKIISQQQTIEEHRALSGAVSRFAQKVDPIVGRYKGSLIYAGGDDVLALLPLHKALECARVLADTFRTEMSDFAVSNSRGKTLVQPTLSVGLAIVHHLEPVSDSLELVRQAESYAKSVKGKNALAITLSKRSGSDQTVGGTWGTIDQRLEWFTELWRREELSAEAAYELRSLVMTLEGPNTSRDDLHQRILSAEMKRILKRKKAERGSREVSKDVVTRLVDLVNTQKVPFRQLADELIIAREFASAASLAHGPVPDVPSGEEAKE